MERFENAEAVSCQVLGVPIGVLVERSSGKVLTKFVGLRVCYTAFQTTGLGQ